MVRKETLDRHYFWDECGNGYCSNCRAEVKLKRKDKEDAEDLPSSTHVPPGPSSAPLSPPPDGGAGAPAPDAAAGRAGQQLGDVLVQRDLVTHEQVQEALELQATSGGRLGELLVQMGVLDERDLVGALALFFGMPVADLRRYKPCLLYTSRCV